MNPVSRLQEVKFQCSTQLLENGFFSFLAVEFEPSPHQTFGINIAEDEVGIRNGDLRASLLVANRAGTGPGASRSDMEGFARIQPGDAASTSAHFSHVDDGNPDQMSPSLDESADQRNTRADLILRGGTEGAFFNDGGPWSWFLPCPA